MCSIDWGLVKYNFFPFEVKGTRRQMHRLLEESDQCTHLYSTCSLNVVHRLPDTGTLKETMRVMKLILPQAHEQKQEFNSCNLLPVTKPTKFLNKDPRYFSI